MDDEVLIPLELEEPEPEEPDPSQPVVSDEPDCKAGQAAKDGRVWDAVGRCCWNIHSLLSGLRADGLTLQTLGEGILFEERARGDQPPVPTPADLPGPIVARSKIEKEVVIIG
ncbi:MAG: hypothetical protein AB1646_21400 [Thermodesulfobacteriota bacterium]